MTDIINGNNTQSIGSEILVETTVQSGSLAEASVIFYDSIHETKAISVICFPHS